MLLLQKQPIKYFSMVAVRFLVILDFFFSSMEAQYHGDEIYFASAVVQANSYRRKAMESSYHKVSLFLVSN